MSNPIGMNICYWSGTSIAKNVSGILNTMSGMGADMVELNPALLLALSAPERILLGNVIRDMGMAVSVNGGLMSAKAELSNSDRRIRMAGLEHCKRVLDACVDVGTKMWTGILHGIWGERPQTNDIKTWIRHKLEASIQGMKQACELAEQADVMYCLEVVNRFEYYQLNTASQGVEFCKQVDSPYCKLLLDTFHMGIEEDNMADAIRLTQAEKLLGCLHIGESNRRVPIGDKSNTNWAEIGLAIQESQYAGPLILEPYEFSAGENSSKVCVWRDLSDPNDLNRIAETGRKGIKFAREMIKGQMWNV